MEGHLLTPVLAISLHMGHFVLSIETRSGNAGPTSLPAVSKVDQPQLYKDHQFTFLSIPGNI